MKKILTIVAVLICLSISISMTVYAQNESEADIAAYAQDAPEEDTAAYAQGEPEEDTAAYAQGEPDYTDPDWYKAYGFETDPRIENPGWTWEEYEESQKYIPQEHIPDEELRAADQQRAANNQPSTVEEAEAIDLMNAQREADMNALNEQRRANGEPLLSDGAAGMGTIAFPDKYWAMNGYPDNISFAYEAGGEMLDDGTSVAYWEIGIIGADEADRQEIINLLSPNCRITFKDCTWSYNQRMSAFDEIYASRNDIVLHVVMVLNSEAVLVEIADGYEKEYARQYIDKYGAFVVVSNEIPVIEDAGGAEIAGSMNGGESPLQADSVSAADGFGMGIAVAGQMPLIQNNWILPAILILICGAAIILYLNRARLVPARQTNTGDIVTRNATVSDKQIITAIKNSATPPSDDVFSSIMEKIDKAQR